MSSSKPMRTTLLSVLLISRHPRSADATRTVPGKDQTRLSCDAIVELDWCVGELMKTLDELKLAEKTLVVFCSDNGPCSGRRIQRWRRRKIGAHRAGGPWTGGKYSVFEGGTRTPFITRWKGRIKPGASDKVVLHHRHGRSLAALTGQDLPKDGCLDSFNVLDALLGEADASGRDHLVQQDNGNNGTYGSESATGNCIDTTRNALAMSLLKRSWRTRRSRSSRSTI